MGLWDLLQQSQIGKLQDQLRTVATEIARLAEANLALQRQVAALQERVQRLEGGRE